MAVVLQKKIENVRYLFGNPDTAMSRYAQLKRIFQENDMYKIFCEPLYSEATNSIIWNTDIEGNALPYAKLTIQDQNYVQKLLSNKISQLIDYAKKIGDSNLLEFVLSAIEIPSINSVYLIKAKDGDKVVLTQWGFVSDQPGDEKGILAKIIAIKRTDIQFYVYYEDSKTETAPNELFYFEFEGQVLSRLSDENGLIILNDVKDQEKILVYRKDEKGNKVNVEEFVSFENAKYQLFVKRLVDLYFKVVDQNDKPLANQTFLFNFQNTTKEHASNTEGMIVIPKVPVGENIEVYQMNENEKFNVSNFVAQKENNFYILKVFVPQKVEPEKVEPTYQMKIKVVDKKNKPLANAFVKIFIEDKVIEKTSDEQGYVIVDDVKPNSKIKVEAQYNKPKKV